MVGARRGEKAPAVWRESRAKMWRMPRRRRAAASRSTSQCGMRTHLVKVRLELQVLQALLNEGDEGAGGKLRALRDGRLRDEGFVAEGVRGVRKSAFLQVSVDEVVDLVGGDGHRCRGPDGADVPCRREVGAIPGRPRGVGMRLGFVCRGMWEARSGSTARSALRAKKARSALQFFFPAVFRSINGSGGRNERERRSRVASSPTVALALIGARAAPRGRVDRRGGRPRASLGAMPLTQITDVFDEPLDLWLSRNHEGQRRHVRADALASAGASGAAPPRPAPRLNPRGRRRDESVFHRRRRVSRRSRRRRRAVPVHPRRRRRGAVVALFRRVSRASRRRRRARASRPPPRARRSDWPDSPRPLRHPRPRRARPSRRRRGGGARLLLRGWRPHRLRRSPTRRRHVPRLPRRLPRPRHRRRRLHVLSTMRPQRDRRRPPRRPRRGTPRARSRGSRESRRVSRALPQRTQDFRQRRRRQSMGLRPGGMRRVRPVRISRRARGRVRVPRVACGLPGMGRGVDCCPTIVLRRARASHRAACPYRLAPCPVPGCGRTVQHNRKAQHVSGCEFRTAECPNGCGWRGRRGEVTNHRSRCGLETTTCAREDSENPAASCAFRAERRFMAAHETECEYRAVACAHCGRGVSARHAAVHEASCAERRELCEACGANVLARRFAEHAERHCGRARLALRLRPLRMHHARHARGTRTPRPRGCPTTPPSGGARRRGREGVLPRVVRGRARARETAAAHVASTARALDAAARDVRRSEEEGKAEVERLRVALADLRAHYEEEVERLRVKTERFRADADARTRDVEAENAALRAALASKMTREEAETLRASFRTAVEKCEGEVEETRDAVERHKTRWERDVGRVREEAAAARRACDESVREVREKIERHAASDHLRVEAVERELHEANKDFIEDLDELAARQRDLEERWRSANETLRGERQPSETLADKSGRRRGNTRRRRRARWWRDRREWERRWTRQRSGGSERRARRSSCSVEGRGRGEAAKTTTKTTKSATKETRGRPGASASDRFRRSPGPRRGARARERTRDPRSSRRAGRASRGVGGRRLTRPRCDESERYFGAAARWRRQHLTTTSKDARESRCCSGRRGATSRWAARRSRSGLAGRVDVVGGVGSSATSPARDGGRGRVGCADAFAPRGVVVAEQEISGADGRGGWGGRVVAQARRGDATPARGRRARPIRLPRRRTGRARRAPRPAVRQGAARGGCPRGGPRRARAHPPRGDRGGRGGDRRAKTSPRPGPARVPRRQDRAHDRDARGERGEARRASRRARAREETLATWRLEEEAFLAHARDATRAAREPRPDPRPKAPTRSPPSPRRSFTDATSRVRLSRRAGGVVCVTPVDTTGRASAS